MEGVSVGVEVTNRHVVDDTLVLDAEGDHVIIFVEERIEHVSVHRTVGPATELHAALHPCVGRICLLRVPNGGNLTGSKELVGSLDVQRVDVIFLEDGLHDAGSLLLTVVLRGVLALHGNTKHELLHALHRLLLDGVGDAAHALRLPVLDFIPVVLVRINRVLFRVVLFHEVAPWAHVDGLLFQVVDDLLGRAVIPDDVLDGCCS